MRVLRKISAALANLPFLAGIIAVIWLILLHRWVDLGAGIVAMLAMPRLWRNLALSPMAAMTRRATEAARSGRQLPALAGRFVGGIWHYALHGGWAIGVFYFFMDRAEPGTTIPTLLWIYATALIPLAFLANRELDDEVKAESGLVLCAVACALLTMPSISSVQPPAMISAVIGLVGVAALFNLALTSRQVSDGKPVRPPSEGEICRSIEEKGIGAIEETREDAA